MERTLIATTPAAMQEAQAHMIAWSKEKASETSTELRELRSELAIAKRNKWATSPITRRIKREGRRFDFFIKVRKALEAGFYVVPNFPADLIAVRTDAKHHRRAKTPHYVVESDFLQPAKRLPAGKGRYVGAQNTFHRGPDEGKEGAKHKVFIADGFSDVEFPVALMREQTMDATSRAMALKVFDEILECRDQVSRGDPMILGRILNESNRPDTTFFIAWIMPLDRL